MGLRLAEPGPEVHAEGDPSRAPPGGHVIRGEDLARVDRLKRSSALPLPPRGAGVQSRGRFNAREPKGLCERARFDRR